VLLTAYNEAVNLPDLLDAIRARGYGCIVVDDASTDDTQSVARAHGARCVRHPINLGQGFALLTGFHAALIVGCDVVVEMDADGQHDPAEIAAFLERLEETGADVVVGSRRLGATHANASWLRTHFLPHFTALVNRASGYTVSDAMCGFRAFRASALRAAQAELDGILEGQYIAAELFIRMGYTGLTVVETPVHLRDRGTGSSRKGIWRYGFGVLKAIARVLIHHRPGGSRS
jgi:glycosyltransferase involved in cell wall biosynthesis